MNLLEPAVLSDWAAANAFWLRPEPPDRKLMTVARPLVMDTITVLDNEPAVADAAASGRLMFGTVESWLVFKLTGGDHITDASNASRSLLLPLAGASWDEGLCDLFGVPRATLFSTRSMNTLSDIARLSQFHSADSRALI